MEMAAMILSAVLLVLTGGTFLLSFLKGRGEYADVVASLDEKEFKTKNILPAGLFLSERIAPGRLLPGTLQELLRRREVQIINQLVELYGAKDKEFYTSIHRAERRVMALLTAAVLALFGLISCLNGDSGNGLLFATASPLALLGMPFLMDRELAEKIERRRESIQLEFPEFVNKLILLVNAGTTIPKAWSKIVAEEKKDSPLFRELRLCMAEIQAGKPEATAYEAFARRCKRKEIIKFVSVIILNLRKGGSEVIPTLRAQADECWEARKATARRLGETASSKLLGPMAIMLLGIILIVALPAVLSLTGM